MAHISRLSDYVAGGVAVVSILEGKLVSMTASGTLGNLPEVEIAASGTVTPVFVAIVPPDNFQRPTISNQYTARGVGLIRGDLNTGWNTDPYTETYYRKGMSVLEAPTLTSGMLVQLHRRGTVTLTSGCWIDNASAKVNQALLKVADDGTGRFEYTTDRTVAVAYVEEYDISRNYLTVTLL
jgi:hypothetical protein